MALQIYNKKFNSQDFFEKKMINLRPDTTKAESSRKEYEALADAEWRKDYFNEENGGYIATHFYKERDDLRRPGIAAEVKACFELARLGKHILRLPENIPDLIDYITIDGVPYHKLLKYKPGENHPRGYPDAYFDGQTWDFKTSTFNNDDSLRQTIKDGRKADNLIFVTKELSQTLRLQHAIERELGRRLRDGSWAELPNIYCLLGEQMEVVWKKQ